MSICASLLYFVTSMEVGEFDRFRALAGFHLYQLAGSGNQTVPLPSLSFLFSSPKNCLVILSRGYILLLWLYIVLSDGSLKLCFMKL